MLLYRKPILITQGLPLRRKVIYKSLVCQPANFSRNRIHAGGNGPGAAFSKPIDFFNVKPWHDCKSTLLLSTLLYLPTLLLPTLLLIYSLLAEEDHVIYDCGQGDPCRFGAIFFSCSIGRAASPHRFFSFIYGPRARPQQACATSGPKVRRPLYFIHTQLILSRRCLYSHSRHGLCKCF